MGKKGKSKRSTRKSYRKSAAYLRKDPRRSDDGAKFVDVEMPGDRVVEYEGSKVLLVERELAIRLKGHTLDIEDTADGPGLVLLAP